jgi:hypothetical protein
MSCGLILNVAAKAGCANNAPFCLIRLILFVLTTGSILVGVRARLLFSFLSNLLVQLRNEGTDLALIDLQRT